MKGVSFSLIMIFFVVSNGWHFNDPFGSSSSETYVNQQVQYFDQIIDHFTYLNPQFWKQRYFVTDTYFNKQHGPVILYICGEGICNGVADQSWTTTIAQNTNALIIAL